MDEPELSQQQEPSFISVILGKLVITLETYGWPLLIIGIIAFYLYDKFKRNQQNTTRNRNNSTYINIGSKKDEETALLTLQRMEEVRRKQQEKMDEAAAKYLAEKKLKNEEELKAKVEEWENFKEGHSYKSKTKKPDDNSSFDKGTGLSTSSTKPKPKLRSSDYNPLTGTSNGGSSSGGSGYRPSRRGGNIGGG